MADTCWTQVDFHGNSIEASTLSGIVSWMSAIRVDIKEFDNIQIFERWFSGISILHPSNDMDNYLLLNNQLF